MKKTAKTKWDEGTRAAIESEMATPVNPVREHSRQWKGGERVLYRGVKAKVVSQHGNWVRIEESEKGASYQVHADVLCAPTEGPNTALIPPTEKFKAQQIVNETLKGCATRAQYLKAVGGWPAVFEYVNELDFTTTGAGMIKMHVGNKLRAAIRGSTKRGTVWKA